MFNSHSCASGGYASANNYLKINAISGTLVKNHPKSIFIAASANSKVFDPVEPKYEWYGSYRLESKPCVVLQSMLIGDQLFLCEVVSKDDFYAPPADPAPKRFSEMTKFLNDNGIMVMQPVIANEVSAQLMDSVDENVFEEICSQVCNTYLECDEEPRIWDLVDEELRARGLK